MTDALGKKERYTYSSLGRLEKKTDRNGITTTYGYDALGRVVETVTSVGDPLSYAYTLTGQVLREQSDHQFTKYTYDELGRVVSVSEEELSQMAAPAIVTIHLDSNGGAYIGSKTYVVWSNEAVALPTPTRAKYTFIGWSDAPDGGSTDVSEILANLVAEGGTEITLYALWSKNPDATVPTVPTFPTNPPAVEAYSLRNTGNSYTKTYEYDLAGNRTSFVLTKDGETVHNIVYQYDALNRLTGVKQAGQSIAAYTYDVNGNRTRLAYPVSQTITSYTYNKANWVTGVTSRKGNTTLSRYQYTYYASGNQKSVTDKDNVVTGYLYDDLGRLTRETQGSGNNGLTVAYTYDTAGNRTKMVVTGAENYTTTYTYDANNRLTKENKKVGGTTTTTVYIYDDNGNLLQKSNPSGAEQNYYNGFNQLTQTRVGNTVAEYIYNANGIRTSKQVGTSTTYYLLDGGDVVAEYTDGALTASYLRGINLLSRVTTDGTEYYLHNAHGDVVALTNTSGTVTKRYDYDAFGNEENPSDSDTNPFRYCGEYFDKDTETYYLRARYYDPTIGRFTQEDPIRDGANRYIYCSSNPISLIDPTGLSGIMADGSYYITHPLDQQLLELKQEYETATPERRAQIALEAQNIRKSGKEGIDWSVRADAPLDRYLIDEDITDKLNNLMYTVGETHFWKRFTTVSLSTNIARYANFAWMVRPGGIYDLKSKQEWQGKEHFIYQGNIIWYDDPGNIMYGYLGKAMGFSDIVLLSAAGVVQIGTGTSSWSYVSSFFDDPRDQASIRQGIQVFKNTYSWIWW